MVITITNQGYIKRMPLDTYRSQRRGGRGVTAMGTKAEDFVHHLFITTTHHYLLFFTNLGKVYRLKVHEIPEAGRQAKGTAAVNLLFIGNEEKITTVIPVRDFDTNQYLFMTTRSGMVKKTPLSDYYTSRRDGIIAISLREGPVGVVLTNGKEEIVLATKNGKLSAFRRGSTPDGRAAKGVKGISLMR